MFNLRAGLLGTPMAPEYGSTFGSGMQIGGQEGMSSDTIRSSLTGRGTGGGGISGMVGGGGVTGGQTGVQLPGGYGGNSGLMSGFRGFGGMSYGGG